MSLIRDKLKTQEKEQEHIAKKVKSQNVMPTISEQEKVNKIINKISEEFSEVLSQKNIAEIQSDLSEAIEKQCSLLGLGYEERLRIEKNVKLTVLGHGPIEPFLKDETVTEIVVQRYDNIVIEQGGKIHPVKVTFSSEEHLQRIIQRIVNRTGRQINLTTPIVDARLEDGSRVNATFPPVSPDGATLTIRKFNNKAFTGKDYINFGSMDNRMLYFLKCCVEGRISIFVSGGTGTGKTTLLNMLSMYIPEEELIVTIEDTCELKLQQPNVRRMEVRNSTTQGMMQVDQKILVKNALRQRPDRIILGETRDGSVVDLVSAMSTGHEGSMSTIHANSPRNMCDVRIPILYSMNKDVDFSESSIAMQIAEAIQIIVQITRFPDGSRKITQISHVSGVNHNGKITVQDIFRYDRADKTFKTTGYIPESIIKTIESKGFNFNRAILKHNPKNSQNH